MMARMSPENNPAHMDYVKNDLRTFSERGLRTLVMGFKPLSEDEYESWKVKYDEAFNSVNDAEEKIMAVAELIERDLFLLGCTAVEDSLQDDVPQTI